MFSVQLLFTILGTYATILLFCNICVGQVKIDEDQTFPDGGYQRRVNYACEHSLLYAECEPGQVIRFLRGNYGRANTATCYHDSTAEWYCRSEESEKILRERCDGKRSCRIEASNEIFGDTCRNTVKYLDIQYYCVPGDSQEIGAPLKGRQLNESERRVIYACESTQLHAECEEGEWIYLLRARYGRSNSPTCRQDEWYCSADTTDRIVRERCNKKHSCRINVTNEVFGDPCPYNLKYLEMQFMCGPAGETFFSSTTRRTTTTRRKPSRRRTSPTNRRTTASTTEFIPTTTEATTTETYEITTKDGCGDFDLQCLNFHCPEGTGNFAHPTNKNMFIFCMNWKPKADACDEGLVFLERFMTCFSENSLFYFWLMSEEN